MIFCKVVECPTFMVTSACASIITLTTMSVERLVAVRFPFWFQRFFSPNCTSLAVIAIWVLSGLINSWGLYTVHVVNGECVHSLPVGFHRFSGVLIFLVQYALPVVVMIVANSWAIFTLRQRRATAFRKAQTHILHMLLIVVITFVVSLTPSQVNFFLYNLGVVDLKYIFGPTYSSFVVLGFVNSCINSFIYAAKVPNFRRAVDDIRRSLRVCRLDHDDHDVHPVFALKQEDEECA
nr:somatostatin receptor type 1-like [Lytechinus pictus]